ncbi:SLBB domain-containing protein [Sulfurimonas sp. SAG-AH-194-C20]|nr:SLBB domain-containing protein [Sulfurimonas sp. SAG-AH-194-C20]MDF1878586.1 SLBB domain-containing protein [Sulfurimonas sp. SAG-AH-194-C20]
MFLRILLLSFFLSLSLFGAPSIEQLKAAVIADPSLLDTPQAQAEMKKRGITKTDINAKLNKNKDLDTKIIEASDIQNNIDIVQTEENNETNTSEILDQSTLVEDINASFDRLNPFTYKTSREIREELSLKKQVLEKTKLTRYSESFYANKNNIDSSSLPTPDNYIISTGDMLSVHIYGDRDDKYELEVANDGTVDIEYLGPIHLAGKSYKEAKSTLKSSLKHHFKMSSFKVSISRYSSIQVTLIGDVKYPGIYNLSSFSTAKDLLIVSKGVRESASVRDISIKRGGKTIAKLDFYDLLFNAKSVGGTLLKHGDIVVVKKAQKLVSIDGFVNNAAIFELKGNESLAKLIEYAGGMKANASSRHIKVDRYSKNSIFETYSIAYAKAKNFVMQDGDKVFIYQLDASADKSINVYGNVIRPGSYRLTAGLDLTSFLQTQLKEGAKHFFLPETYFEYGIVKSYAKGLNFETKSFNLKKVIEGKENLKLYPQDELYIFSKNDLHSSEYITTKGDVLIEEGKLRFFEGMTIRDAIHGSGIDGILDDKISVTTINTPDRMPSTTFYSLKNDGNTRLSVYDEVQVYDYYKTHLLQPVSIKGEVVKPTTVFYEKNMSLAKLLNASGGTSIEAFLQKIEIVRYYIDETSKRKKKLLTVNLNEVDSSTYFLKPYDEVTVYKIPNWGEKKTVVLQGQVRFPGTYTVSNGEKLSSVIERAGGFTAEAFIEGAVFTRDSIRAQQVSNYNRALLKIKRELAVYNAMPANAKRSIGSTATSNTLNEVIVEAQKYEPLGRVSIKLTSDLEEFKKSQFDLVLKDKDTLTIPNQIDTVTVFGEVFNSSSFVYDSELDADEYIKMASGLSRAADEDSIYVIHADGRSELLSGGFFSASVKIQKGDTIVVPLYIKETNTLDIWDSVSRILASFAITVASLNTLGVI